MVRGGASANLRRVDKILDALEQQLVLQENLAAITCEGNLQRACSTCGKEVTIRAVCSGGVRVEGTPSVLLHPTSSDLFSCGHSDCPLEMSPEALSWGIAVQSTWHKLLDTKCDNCFLLAPAQDVHRSYHHSCSCSKTITSFFSQVTLPDQKLLQQGVLCCR